MKNLCLIHKVNLKDKNSLNEIYLSGMILLHKVHIKKDPATLTALTKPEGLPTSVPSGLPDDSS